MASRSNTKRKRTVKYHLRANRQARSDIFLFGDLIETPHDFGAINSSGAEHPLPLPGKGRLAVSSSSAMTQGGLLVTIGDRNQFGIPDLEADEIHKGTFGEKTQVVDILSDGASGDFTLYFVDEFGNEYPIGSGVLPAYLLQENGDRLLQEDGSGIIL